MKEIKILKAELQIGDQKIMLSMDEMKELKRVLLEAFPESDPVYIPYVPHIPYDWYPEKPYEITYWDTWVKLERRFGGS